MNFDSFSGNASVWMVFCWDYRWSWLKFKYLYLKGEENLCSLFKKLQTYVFQTLFKGIKGCYLAGHPQNHPSLFELSTQIFQKNTRSAWPRGSAFRIQVYFKSRQ